MSTDHSLEEALARVKADAETKTDTEDGAEMMSTEAKTVAESADQSRERRMKAIYHDLLNRGYAFESQSSIAYTLSILPILFCLFVLGNNLQPGTVVSFLLGFIMEGFMFMNMHLATHVLMLSMYRAEHVGLPYAFFHHYVDSNHYGKLPAQYNMVAVTAIAPTSMVLWLLGLEATFVLGVICATFVDVYIHGFIHTRNSQATYLNPFTVYSRYPRDICKLLCRCGFIDPNAHIRLHHAEKAENMHQTADFMDMRIPLVSLFYDWYSDMQFKLVKSIFHCIQHSVKASVVYTDPLGRLFTDGLCLSVVYVLSMLPFLGVYIYQDFMGSCKLEYYEVEMNQMLTFIMVLSVVVNFVYPPVIANATSFFYNYMESYVRPNLK